MLNIDFIETPSFKKIEKNWLDQALISDNFEIDGHDNQYAPIYNKKEKTEVVAYFDDYEIIKFSSDFEPATVAAKINGEIVGFYSGAQSWVEPDHRGHGLGKALIVSSIAVFKELQINYEEPIGMSQLGYEVHKSAMREINHIVAQDQPQKEKKSDRKAHKETTVELSLTDLVVDLLQKGIHDVHKIKKMTPENISLEQIQREIRYIVSSKKYELWTEENVNKLISMAKEAKLSYVEMAAELGVLFTKNSIAGKLKRIGIKVTEQASENAKKQKKQKAAAHEIDVKNSVNLKKPVAKKALERLLSQKSKKAPVEKKTKASFAKKESFKSIEKTSDLKNKEEVQEAKIALLTSDQKEDYDLIEGLKPTIFDIGDLKKTSCREPYIGEKHNSIFYCGRECNKTISHSYCTDHARKNLVLTKPIKH